TILPLTLDPGATVHAWLGVFTAFLVFWTTRTLLSRGGIRTTVTGLAWVSVGFGLEAFAQSGVGTNLVYGFWRPRDPGARPLGPFINRNHFGTWGIMAICLCVGYLQRRGGGQRCAPWRARLARWMDGRRLVLQLAVVMLAATIALGASRSSLVALACAAGYVALAAPTARGRGGR